MIRKKKAKIEIISCYQHGTGFMFTLNGECKPGTLLEVHIRPDGVDVLVAIVTVESWDTEGTLLAYTIWFDREKLSGKPLNLLVDPYVRLTPMTLRGLDRYMEAEGKQGIAHVLYTSQYIYIVNRLNYKDRVSHYPWICYLLDKNNDEYSAVQEANSLDEIQTWLIGRHPNKRREILEWHLVGRKIYNLLDCGVFADGVNDDTNKVIRVLNSANRGDIIYLPSGRRMKVRKGIMLPRGVEIDIHQEQFITGDASP